MGMQVNSEPDFTQNIQNLPQSQTPGSVAETGSSDKTGTPGATATVKTGFFGAITNLFKRTQEENSGTKVDQKQARVTQLEDSIRSLNSLLATVTDKKGTKVLNDQKEKLEEQLEKAKQSLLASSCKSSYKSILAELKDLKSKIKSASNDLTLISLKTQVKAKEEELRQIDLGSESLKEASLVYGVRANVQEVIGKIKDTIERIELTPFSPAHAELAASHIDGFKTGHDRSERNFLFLSQAASEMPARAMLNNGKGARREAVFALLEAAKEGDPNAIKYVKSEIASINQRIEAKNTLIEHFKAIATQAFNEGNIAEGRNIAYTSLGMSYELDGLKSLEKQMQEAIKRESK